MDRTKATWTVLVLLLLALAMGSGGSIVSTKATAVTYVFEKDDGGIPSGVTAALAELNTRGIMATTFEDDTTDANGDVPEQYKVALAESKKQGVPLVVAQAGERVIRTVKSPVTSQQVLEVVP